MRKHLIGTILVLAALAACNKEIDTQTPAIVDPVEETPAGKVTLTFKATIGEETRTVYANDKTASWAAGDKISVCLTDSESYEVVDFTTEDGITFTGDVNPGYTTPVSAIYPANEVYTTYAWNSYFSQENGSVTAVRLADGYELGSADDPGKFIPLIGSYDGEKMEFHHFCSTMKVTLTNIPDDAAYFTFTTNKQKLVSDFTLTDGRMGLVSQEDDVDTSVYFEFEPGSLTTRSFYIPVPDGTLAANSFVTLSNADEVLFKKRITSSPTFGLNDNGKDAIRVLPEVACWTRNENWNAFYYGIYKNDSGAFRKSITIENVTGKFQYEVLTASKFSNTYHSSAAEYLASSDFSNKLSGLSASDLKSGNLSLVYTSLNPGTRYVMIFGLDNDLHFTGEYNCVEVVYPELSTPEGWDISVVDDFKITYTVPSGIKWTYISVSESTFGSTYNDNLEYLIYKVTRDHKSSYDGGSSSWAPITTQTKTYTVAYNGNYVLLCVGIDDNYRPTGEYCRLDHAFETPTEAYKAWIGKWSLSNGDTWTVSRKQANHTYNVKGLCGLSTITVEAQLTDEGNLLFKTQAGVAKTTYEGFNVTINLYKKKTLTGSFYTSIGNLMQATMDGQTATLAPTNATYPVYTMIGSYKNADDETKYVGYGSNRSAADVTMTRVTE